MTDDKNALSDAPVHDVSNGLIQTYRDVNYRGATAIGMSVAVGVGIMAILGRFVFSYTPEVNFAGY